MANPLRYFTSRAGTGGAARYYWQPSSELRLQGYRCQRLADDPLEAQAQAQALNAALDEKRRSAKEQATASAEPKPVAPKPPSARSLANLHLTFVYVIGSDEGSQKVGMTRHPSNRLSDLQHATPKRLRMHLLIGTAKVDAAEAERLAHAHLVRFRRRGEWFSCRPEEAVAAVFRAFASLSGQPAPNEP